MSNVSSGSVSEDERGAGQPAPDATVLIPRITEAPPHPIPPDATAVDATAVIELPDLRRAAPDPDQTVLLRAVTADTGEYLGAGPASAPSVGRPPAYDSVPGQPGYRSRHGSGWVTAVIELPRTWRTRAKDLGELVPEEGSRLSKAFRAVGEFMITCGLILLLFAAYEVWGKAAIIQNHQHDLDQLLEQEWAQGETPSVAPTTPPPNATASPVPAAPPGMVPGDRIARLYVPRLGMYWIVVEGVEPQDILYAPGHYPGTALPGEVGNFSLAGHRAVGMWWDLDQLRPNDPIVVETRTAWYIYRVDQSKIVSPNAIEVVAPVPGSPGVAPTEAWLTLTTCNPKWDNYERLIVHAKLGRSQPRDAGRPAELGGM